MMITEFRIPDLGGARDVDVIEVAVAVGDQIEPEQTLLVLETDKASMEIPAEVTGKVVELKVVAGDKVNEGDTFIVLEAADNVHQGTPDHEDVGTQQNILIPDLGGSEGVEVIEIAVAAGDQVDAEQTVLVLESDKATMEIPAGLAGTIVKLAVKVGDKVSQGDAMLSLRVRPGTSDTVATVAESVSASQPEKEDNAPVPVKTTSQSVITQPVEKSTDDVHAGPSVRKLAREFGVDLNWVPSTGPKNRITKDDVQAYVKQQLQNPSPVASGSGIPAVPEVDFAQFGSVHTEPLNNIKKATAKAMTTAWLNVPQVTQFDQADITDLETYRQQQNQLFAAQGIKFSIVPFILKALAKVLQEFPSFNASLSSDGEALVLKNYVHIGVAVDTPKGLLVPVIRDVDTLSVTEITQQLNEKAQRAREGKLTLLEMQGGCFSLSSLGGIGGSAFTPIVNPPEVAILGLSKSEMQPKWNGTEFIPRLMLPLSLSYDHRVIDGAEAARFSQRLVVCLQDLRNVLM